MQQLSCGVIAVVEGEEMSDDQKIPLGAISSSRLFAFLGVVLSTASVITCVICFPVIFHQLQVLHSSVERDLDFCGVRIAGI